MGIAVIFGLMIGSFLTLYIIPAIYSYFATEKSDLEVDEERIRKAEKLQVTSIHEPS
jgi:multidrug efflux pump